MQVLRFLPGFIFCHVVGSFALGRHTYTIDKQIVDNIIFFLLSAYVAEMRSFSAGGSRVADVAFTGGKSV